MFQLIATLSLSIKLQKRVREMSAERDRNACREGSLLLVRGKTWQSIQGICFQA